MRLMNVLDLSRTAISDSTLALIGQHIPNLTCLSIKCCAVSDTGLINIVTNCRNLRELDVSNVANLSDRTGTQLGHLTELAALYVKDNANLTNATLAVIQSKVSPN